MLKSGIARSTRRRRYDDNPANDEKVVSCLCDFSSLRFRFQREISFCLCFSSNHSCSWLFLKTPLICVRARARAISGGHGRQSRQQLENPHILKKKIF
jgi:hypothetical protein